MPMTKSAAIISKPAKPELATILPELLAWFHKHGYKVYLDEETAKYVEGEEVVPRSAARGEETGFCFGARRRRDALISGARRGS